MKTLTTIYLILLSAANLHAQKVSSDCTAPDSIFSKYKNDADRLALQSLFSYNFYYNDSVTIPKDHSAEVMKWLMAVYNAKNLPARDSVVTMFDIHTYGPEMNSFSVDADTNLPWMQQIKLRNIPTGDSLVDELISTYHLRLNEYSYSDKSLSTFSLFTRVYFETDSNINISAITKIFKNMPGVKYAEASPIYGDGNGIGISIYVDHVQLRFGYGWGDCPSGCLAGHSWAFNVYPDCSVEFVGGYGNSLEPDFFVSPNPFTSTISIYNNNEGSYYIGNYNYCIYDLYGRKILSGDYRVGDQIDNVEGLSIGFYILTIESNGYRKAFQILKNNK